MYRTPLLSATILFVLGLTFGVSSSGELTKLEGKEDRDTLWSQVQKAEAEGLPKSAAKLLTQIYDSALADDDFDEATKAWCYRLRVEGRINQPEYPYVIRKLQAEVPKLPDDIKPLAQVIQAKWFLNYYYQNRWKFAQRSQTGQSPSDDFETWDLPRILSEIDRLLTDALSESEKLKQIPIEQLADLLQRGTLPDTYRPTAFDFIANEAIHFYALNEQITREQNAFEIDSTSPIFADSAEFLAWNPPTEDTDAAPLKAVKLFQKLLKFHADDEDQTAFLDANLSRLRFGRKTAVGGEVAVRYQTALQVFADKNAAHELSSLAIALRASSLKSEDQLVEAHAAARTGMKRFPDSVGGKQCFNIIQMIEAKSIQISTEQVWNKANPELTVNYKNIEEVHFQLAPFDYRKWKWGNGNPLNDLRRNQNKAMTPVASWTDKLQVTDDFKMRKVSVPAKVDIKPGCYILRAGLNRDFSKAGNILSASLVWVTNLNVVSRNTNNNSVKGQVLDAISGGPLSDVEVSVYSWKRDGRNSVEVFEGTTKTDVNGFYNFRSKNQNQHMVYFRKGRDQFALTDYVYQRAPSTDSTSRTYFFTDRSIYRPGQTVQFKGICVAANRDSNTYRIDNSPGQIRVQLLDPNNQQIVEKAFRTNEFGSFSGSFAIPRDRGTGRMRFRTAGGPMGSAQIRVEEYKRPKFFVEVENPKEQSRLEQPVNVNVKATAYTGAVIDGAKVSWRVVRTIRYPQWWYWRCWYMPISTDSQEIANGEGITTVDGNFNIEFPATPDRSVDRSSQPVFVYTVTADVTDTAGETRSSTQTINIGYTSLQADLAVDDWLVADKPIEFKLKTSTLDDEPQAAKGTLTVYSLKNPETVQRKRLMGYWAGQSTDQSDIKSWEIDKALSVEKAVATNDKGMAKPSFELKAGAYKAVFETTDKSGQTVSAEVPFHVVDLKARSFSTRIANFFSAESWSLEPGEKFNALWGTGYETGRAWVEFEHRGRVIKSFWTEPGKTQAPISFDIEEKHRGGLQVRITYVRENRAYLESRTIAVPWSNKQLSIKWEHFVSNLTPGGKETWTAVISGPDAKKTAAEMVAGMYDASLDAFAKHAWPNQIKSLFYRDYSRTNLQFRNQIQPLQGYHFGLRLASKPIVATYRSFDGKIVDQWSSHYNMWYAYETSGGMGGLGGGGYGGGGFGGGGMGLGRGAMQRGGISMGMNMSMGQSRSFAAPAMMADSAMRMETASEAAPMAASMPRKKGESGPASGGAPASAANLDQVSARTNLQETAFFYPQLMTDENGTVRIEFEIPEALTKWKFLGFAHDKDLRTAMLVDEVTTSKDLMVQPNPPRFLREGDQLEFSVKISNVSDVQQTGNVRLTLADATTEKSLDNLFGNKALEQAFDVSAGQSKSVFWKLSVPDYVGVLTWKAVGATESLSDGEEGLLPVLSKRILVVESLPLPIRGNQTKTFEFDRLDMIDSSDSLKSQSLTVQMTSNPSWYAVMALPYLMEYPYQCNEQIFNRLYANAIGQHIVNSQPKIKKVFDQWRESGDALDSPLEKNEDIRNILIAETPWLRAGKKESQARRDVANLFDKNRINNEVRRATRQLAERQYSDGSWSWFPGGTANDFITLYITTGFGRLRQLGVEVDETAAIKSLNRLDNWINNQYQRLKRDDLLDRKNLSSTTCLYLYGRSFFLKDKAIADQHREAVDYFLGQAKEHWLGQSKMSQGQLAIATKRFGDAVTPKAIMASLTERSQSSEEMGRFWRESRESWWWYRAPIETQAMLIEAYSEVSDDAEAVEDCKIWLLKQKQTQNWKTTKATADAVYALLLRGKDRLASDRLVEVSLGDIKIEPSDIEAGTGFYQQKFAGSEVNSKMKIIEVKKSDDGIAWGSVHWQYLEDVAKIKPYEGTPLTLKKSLHLKKNTKAGPTITPITGPVEVGDEVVSRVEIRVDRDMEYVHLKDQRGSGTEPVNVLSTYKRQDGLSYYESTRDTASHFFIDYLPRGTYVFEYSVRVQHRGEYQSGIATLQCMYAPEFNSHSNSVAIEVK